jgi:hypothetical protein
MLNQLLQLGAAPQVRIGQVNLLSPIQKIVSQALDMTENTIDAGFNDQQDSQGFPGTAHAIISS